MVTSLLTIEDNKGLFGRIKGLYHWFWMLWYGIPWMIQIKPATMRPKVFEFFHSMKKAEAANLPVGVAGFCWGGESISCRK